MRYHFSTKKVYVALATLTVFGGLFIYSLDRRGSLSNYSFGLKKAISINVADAKEVVEVEQTRAQTVCDLLEEHNIDYTPTHKILPGCDKPIVPEMIIEVLPERKLTVNLSDRKVELSHHGKRELEEILRASNIVLSSDDIVETGEKSPLEDGATIQVIKVTREEDTRQEKISFQEIIQEDADREEGQETVTQEGVEGLKEIRSLITYHDGKEVTTEILEEQTIIEKKDRIVVKGTKEKEQELNVKLGDFHEGQSSWYAYKDCDCAANPWLPKGSRVKVTAVNSGKSVIVTINDRGPFVPGRIIDLDKTAFEKIAPLGAGVIDVKMEEVIE